MMTADTLSSLARKASASSASVTSSRLMALTGGRLMRMTATAPSRSISINSTRSSPRVCAGGTPALRSPVFAGGTPALRSPVFAGGTPALRSPVFAGGTPALRSPVFAGGTPALRSPVFAGGTPALLLSQRSGQGAGRARLRVRPASGYRLERQATGVRRQVRDEHAFHRGQHVVPPRQRPEHLELLYYLRRHTLRLGQESPHVGKRRVGPGVKPVGVQPDEVRDLLVAQSRRSTA